MSTNAYNLEEINIYLDAEIYAKKGIFKTLYWYGDKFITLVNKIKTKSEYFHIQLKPLKKLSIEEMRDNYERLQRDLVDFQLRQIIHEETCNLRDLITAKAFANGDLDELPKGDISDPVGFLIK